MLIKGNKQRVSNNCVYEERIQNKRRKIFSVHISKHIHSDFDVSKIFFKKSEKKNLTKNSCFKYLLILI